MEITAHWASFRGEHSWGPRMAGLLGGFGMAPAICKRHVASSLRFALILLGLAFLLTFPPVVDLM
jgi:hypothetical protein